MRAWWPWRAGVALAVLLVVAHASAEEPTVVFDLDDLPDTLDGLSGDMGESRLPDGVRKAHITLPYYRSSRNP